jgi:hypothetical protein
MFQVIASSQDKSFSDSVAFSYGKPVAYFPENALKQKRRRLTLRRSVIFRTMHRLGGVTKGAAYCAFS